MKQGEELRNLTRKGRREKGRGSVRAGRRKGRARVVDGEGTGRGRLTRVGAQCFGGAGRPRNAGKNEW